MSFGWEGVMLQEVPVGPYTSLCRRGTSAFQNRFEYATTYVVHSDFLTSDTCNCPSKGNIYRATPTRWTYVEP